MTHAPLTDEDLVAYFEEALPASERAALETRIQADPQAQAKLLEWARQNAEIQALYADPGPTPDRLSAALHPPARPDRAPLRIAAMLGFLAVGATGGWFSHASLRPTAPEQMLAEAAIRAHDTYVVEVVHPVEVPATQRAHMDSWMSKRMGTEMRPPDLAASGYALMGGRILPSDDGPAGLYMYENADGKRITLYVSHQPGGDSAFQFTDAGPVQSLHWSDGGLGYALTGDMPRDRLKTVAKTAYDQLL